VARKQSGLGAPRGDGAPANFHPVFFTEEVGEAPGA